MKNLFFILGFFCANFCSGQHESFLRDRWLEFNGPSNYTKDSISSSGTCYSIQQALRNKKQVRSLSIREFGFCDLEKEIKKLKKLKRLSSLTVSFPINHYYSQDKKIYRNNLNHLSKELHRLKRLEYLMVYAPDTSMLKAIEKLKNLKGLCVLFDDNIGRLNPFFSNLSNLQKLDTLFILGFYGINPSIYTLSNLKYLSAPVSGSDTASLKKLSQLNSLVIGHTAKGGLPTNIGDLTQLELLICMSTLTGEFNDSFIRLKNLKRLRISVYKDIQEQIYKLPALEELFLTGQFEIIPNKLSALKKMKKLALYECNALKKLDFDLNELDSLRDITIYSSNSDSLSYYLDLSLLEKANQKIKLSLRGISLNFLNEKTAAKISELNIETNWKAGIAYPSEEEIESLKKNFPGLVLKVSGTDVYAALFKFF